MLQQPSRFRALWMSGVALALLVPVDLASAARPRPTPSAKPGGATPAGGSGGGETARARPGGAGEAREGHAGAAAGERGDGREGSTSGQAAAIRDKLGSPSGDQADDLASLREDLATVGQGVQGAEAEIRALAEDLQGMGLQKPDPALAQDLAKDLQGAMGDAELSKRELAELSQDVWALLNSAGLSQQEVEVLLADVEDILSASGVSQQDVQAIVDDLEALAEDAREPSGAAAGGPRGRRPGSGS